MLYKLRNLCTINKGKSRKLSSDYHQNMATLGVEDRHYLQTLVEDTLADNFLPRAPEKRRQSIWEKGSKMIQESFTAMKQTYDELKFRSPRNLPENSLVLLHFLKLFLKKSVCYLVRLSSMLKFYCS